MNKNKFYLIIIAMTLIFATLPNTLLLAEEATVLERIRKVEDPELARLIEIAIENLPEKQLYGNTTKPQELYDIRVAKSKTIRIVTEKYAQIILLDNKIRLLEEKMKPDQGPEIKSEFIISKASLESERLKCIAELRGALNLVPWTPFGPKELNELNSWIHIEALGKTIRLFDLQKPFSPRFEDNSCKEIRFESSKQAVEYLEDILRQNNSLPIRITQSEKEEGSVVSKDLRKEIQRLITKTNTEYQVELSPNINPVKETRKDNIIFLGGSNIIDDYLSSRPSEIKDYIEAKRTELLNKPQRLPRTIKIKCADERFEKKAKNLEQALQELVNELKLNDMLTIEISFSN